MRCRDAHITYPKITSMPRVRNSLLGSVLVGVYEVRNPEAAAILVADTQLLLILFLGL